MTDCRGCHAPIVWARTATDNHLIPLDPDPVEGGNIAVVSRSASGEINTVQVLGQADLFANEPRYVTHFATCEFADDFRRQR